MNSTAVYRRAFDTDILNSGLTNIKMHYSSTVSMQLTSHKLVRWVETLKNDTMCVFYPNQQNLVSLKRSQWTAADHRFAVWALGRRWRGAAQLKAAQWKPLPPKFKQFAKSASESDCRRRWKHRLLQEAGGWHWGDGTVGWDTVVQRWPRRGYRPQPRGSGCPVQNRPEHGHSTGRGQVLQCEKCSLGIIQPWFIGTPVRGSYDLCCCTTSQHLLGPVVRPNHHFRSLHTIMPKKFVRSHAFIMPLSPTLWVTFQVGIKNP